MKERIKNGLEIGRKNAELIKEAGGLAGEIELEKTDEDLYIEAMMDQIWCIYDDDENNVLDIHETKKFVVDYIAIM